MSRLAIVTATLDPARAEDCLASWRNMASAALDLYVVLQAGAEDGWQGGGDTLIGQTLVRCMKDVQGVVPAFALGVAKALEDGAQVIACLHDDLRIDQRGWDAAVLAHFRTHPQAGLLGFGGGVGLGAEDIYQTPYNPMQLARQVFVSNMRDAEAHGLRVNFPVRVACLDGFSQVGTCEFWRGNHADLYSGTWVGRAVVAHGNGNLFEQMQKLGVIHHFYDGMLGCYAKRLGYDVWMLPIACHHFGGRTAVGDARYTEWANKRAADGGAPDVPGDGLFWEQAHQIGYDHFKDVLPIRVEA